MPGSFCFVSQRIYIGIFLRGKVFFVLLPWMVCPLFHHHPTPSFHSPLRADKNALPFCPSISLSFYFSPISPDVVFLASSLRTTTTTPATMLPPVGASERWISQLSCVLFCVLSYSSLLSLPTLPNYDRPWDGSFQGFVLQHLPIPERSSPSLFISIKARISPSITFLEAHCSSWTFTLIRTSVSASFLHLLLFKK